MNKSLHLESLRAAFEQGQIEWQRHCLQRMVERGISRHDVIQVISQGERIADYPEDRPLPSALILGVIDRRPLHVVVALNSDLKKAFVITVYEPDLEHFEPDFKTRRKV